MLKEQLAKIFPTTSLCEICYLHKPENYTRKDCITYGKRLCAYEDMLVDQILNLFKAEVDKLTVIDDEEQDQLYSEWEDEVGTYFGEHDFNRDDPNAPGNWDARLKECQLQHAKEQLLDLMG